MIPPIVHLIWLGDAPLPPEYAAFADAWATVNPGWEVRLWDERTLPPLRNQAAFDAAATWAGKADVARLELLLEHGGVYADCDFEPLRPLAPLLDGVGFFAARDWGGWIPNTLMGSAPGHPVTRALVEAIPARCAANPGGPPNELSGPHLVTEVVGAVEGRDPTVKVFPKEVFYPYPYEERHLHHIGEDFPGAVAVHHWAASWIARRVVVALDWARFDAVAGVAATFCRLFGAGDHVELMLATAAEPTPADAQVAAHALADLLPAQDAPEILLASFAEALQENFDVAVVATGEPRAAAIEAAQAVAWMTRLRLELDGGAAGRLPAPRIVDRATLLPRLQAAAGLRAA